MAAGNVHTVYKHESWVNKLEEGEELATFQTKEEAVSAGRHEARHRKTEHVVHNMDGTISQRNSYGNDPASRPG